MKNASNIIRSLFNADDKKTPFVRSAEALIKLIESGYSLDLIKKQLQSQASKLDKLRDSQREHRLLNNNSHFRTKNPPAFPYKDELLKAKYAVQFLEALWPNT